MILSVGMMTFSIYGKIKNVPNHQPDGVCHRISESTIGKVGGAMTILKNMSSSIGKDYSPYIREKKMFETTNEIGNVGINFMVMLYTICLPNLRCQKPIG